MQRKSLLWVGILVVPFTFLLAACVLDIGIEQQIVTSAAPVAAATSTAIPPLDVGDGDSGSLPTASPLLETGTPLPTATSMPTATRAAPVIYTLTPTRPLPTATLTPSPAATQPPGIITFTASPAEVYIGDSVTLTWGVTGGPVSIRTIQANGVYGPWYNDLEAAGSLDAPVTYYDPVTFQLVVGEGEGALTRQITVPVLCATEWFFEGGFEDKCPRPVTASAAAAQHFEHGLMVWVEQTGAYYGFVNRLLYQNEDRKTLYLAYDPLDITADTSADYIAPAGLYAPVSGFGLLWRGDTAGSAGLQDVLGWATEPEFGYQTKFQCESPSVSGGRNWMFCFLLAPNGRVIALHPLGGWLWLEELQS